MASTITAGNATNGLAISADNTGILQLKTGTGAGTVGLTIDASQNATFAGTVSVATGALYPLASGTVQTISGTPTSIDFTNIPATAKRITVMFSSVDTTATANILVQIGTAGSPDNTGYLGQAMQVVTGNVTNGTSFTTGFGIFRSSAYTVAGTMVLTLINPATNTWVGNATGASLSTGLCVLSGGTKTLSGVLNIVRVTLSTSTFSGGSINLMWE